MKYITFILGLLAPLSALGLTVTDVVPGGLAKTVGADTLQTELTVSGRINAADFAFIADKMPQLRTLDLSAATVDGYKGEPLPYTQFTRSAANALPDYALTGMASLTDLTLPADITSIGTGALSGSGITSLTIPATVTTVGDYACLRCEALASVTIPASVTSIGTRAFANCTALRTVIFAEQSPIASLPEGSFEGCTALTDINLADLTQCTDIGPWALAHCDGMTALVLPADIASLQRGSLMGMNQVKMWVIPENLQYIGDNAMAGWTSLTDIDAEQTRTVPALGSDVWSNVDQAAVQLMASDDMADDFRAAEQWQEFKVTCPKDLNGIDPMADAPRLTVTADGTTLTVSSADGSLTHTAVFNAGGTRMGLTTASPATFGVSGWTRGVYLIVTNLGIAKITL